MKYALFLILIFNGAIIGGAQASPNRTESFDPSGDYHPLTRPVNESDKFIQFDLQVRRKNGKLVAWGEVRGVQPWYKFRSVFVTEKQLRFSTVKVGGVSYEFDGRFLAKGNFASQSVGNGIVMLEGTLRRFVNGKKDMEVSTSFLYFAGC
ncbi:MAG TPA: hypothetical protein VN643_17765 [Pyrinomonadaceae bacterium]|nr:hypothetical protein [Pyrinomonadaceae bacterium]